MMDNCLASNSETGGVGCDNMTMIVVGFLNGKTKEEWYEEIAQRVANGDGPCAPPEYGKLAPVVHDAKAQILLGVNTLLIPRPLQLSSVDLVFTTTTKIATVALRWMERIRAKASASV